MKKFWMYVNDLTYNEKNDFKHISINILTSTSDDNFRRCLWSQ